MAINYRKESSQLLYDFLMYHKNIQNHSAKTVQEYFLDLFQDYDKEVNPLNWVVHRPEQYQLPAKDLIDLPRKGLLSLINFLIS